MDDIELLTRRLARERQARKSAEQIAETKSRELYLNGQALQRALEAESAARAEVARLYREVEILSFTDPLTGLANRRRLETEAPRLLALAERHLRPLALLMIDLDHFKRVNDTYGHGVGDSVLRGVSAALLETVRSSDLCARYGGEELCVVLPETDEPGAVDVARRFMARLADLAFEAGDTRFFVTASVGVACRVEGDSIDAILGRADSALYRAKQEGRNRVVPHAPQAPGADGAT